MHWNGTRFSDITVNAMSVIKPTLFSKSQLFGFELGFKAAEFNPKTVKDGLDNGS